MPRGRSGWAGTISPPTGFDPLTVQPERFSIPTTFMQGIYSYMSETNHVSRVYSVAAIL